MSKNQSSKRPSGKGRPAPAVGEANRKRTETAKQSIPQSAGSRIFSVPQIEALHPGVLGRLRAWIHRADHHDPDLAWLRKAIIRVGRSVLIDEEKFVAGLRTQTNPPSAGRADQKVERVTESA